MSGLLVKDLCLTLKRKQAIIIFLIVMVVMGFSMGGSFLIGYGTLLFGILTIGTISYDDIDNGRHFLFTLPITHKDYAREKYLFCGLSAVIGWVLSLIIGLALGGFTDDPIDLIADFPEALAALLLIALFIAIMIPIQIKFGAEKSRIVMVVIFGIALVIGMAARYVLPSPEEAAKMIDNIPEAAIIIGLAVLCAIANVVGIKISEKILENK